MQAHKTSLLDHLRWAREVVLDGRGDLLLAGNALELLIRRGGRTWALRPRFVDEGGRVTASVPGLREYLKGFAGWLPYETIASWEIATDRRRLNAFLLERRFSVVRQYPENDGTLENVVVRRPRAAGEDATIGPFSRSAERPLDPAQDEYYEQLPHGSRVRLWFWNERPIIGEIHRMASVLGDGVHAARELILERALLTRPLTEADEGALLARVAPLLSVQGYAFSTVPPRGAHVLIDHRIDSPLAHPADRQTFVLERLEGVAWLATARRAGAEILADAPAERRTGVLFTLDGVLGADGEFSLVEMDANPIVHPAAYPVILGALFEKGEVGEAPTRGDT